MMDMSEFMSAKAEARNNTDTFGPTIPSPFPWVAFLFPAHSRLAHLLYKALLPLLCPPPHLTILSIPKHNALRHISYHHPYDDCTGHMGWTSWIISTTNDTINQDVTGGGILPPSVPLTHHASKCPEATALYASLMWIDTLLAKHPDNTSNAGMTPALLIPVDNKSVIDNILHPVTDLSPTFMMLTPDFDIIQAIRRLLKKLPIPVDIFHIKAHQDHEKPYDELNPFAQINILVDTYANQLHQCSPSSLDSSQVGYQVLLLPSTMELLKLLLTFPTIYARLHMNHRCGHISLIDPIMQLAVTLNGWI